jgi:hypothetical protein
MNFIHKLNELNEEIAAPFRAWNVLNQSVRALAAIPGARLSHSSTAKSIQMDIELLKSHWRILSSQACSTCGSLGGRSED